MPLRPFLWLLFNVFRKIQHTACIYSLVRFRAQFVFTEPPPDVHIESHGLKSINSFAFGGNYTLSRDVRFLAPLS